MAPCFTKVRKAGPFITCSCIPGSPVQDSCGKALPATPQELSVVLASPYQELLLNSPVVYPCDNLYELALLYSRITGH